MDTFSSKITIGILAHVDAGKTTLSEALLHLTGKLRKAGRVDHGDAFLDTHSLEKKRGITIFSKPALFSTPHRSFTLLDTPGHGDLTPETERVLDILDYAVLVISAPEAASSRSLSLWQLLEHYRVPVFVFVNKMDQPGMEEGEVFSALQKTLAGEFLSGESLLKNPEEVKLQESLAMLEEELLSRYLEGQPVNVRDIGRLIKKRLFFPVFFGSALKMTGVSQFLEALDLLTLEPEFPDAFQAKVYKITHEGPLRLTWVRLTGGRLRIRDRIDGEIVDGIRRYSGSGYEALSEAEAGEVVALQGLISTHAGKGLGSARKEQREKLVRPIEQAKVILSPGTDPYKAYEQLKLLEEEEPQLSLSFSEGKISLGIMGQVQEEILKALAKERFDLDISFGPPEIIYMETITQEAEGAGHFEPLRHYAEVHLLLSPAERGSGLSFGSLCSRDMLPEHFQRLILSQLQERPHFGVLTGSPLTDVKIMLLAGKAHEKHTESGDFREAACRALRQGLMESQSLLLEPWLRFRLKLPAEYLGRAMSELTRMEAETDPPIMEESETILAGRLPAAELGDFPRQLASFSSGRGRLALSLAGYFPCRHPEEIIAKKAYDPLEDAENPSSSVFCSHGRGELIPWDRVKGKMHVDSGWRPAAKAQEAAPLPPAPASGAKALDFKAAEKARLAKEQELRDIFLKVHGPIKEVPRATAGESRDVPREEPLRPFKQTPPKPSYLLVDGYNMIFAWPELKELIPSGISAARDRLMDMLVNYAGATGENIILVFDAYKVAGGEERVCRYHNIDVVYTREAETADQYIERCAHRLRSDNRVTVATSDGIEQVIVFGAGAIRLSADNFLERIREEEEKLREFM